MVSLELRELAENADQLLENEIDRQVAEIMEAAVVEEEQTRNSGAPYRSWNFSMPFAGVRYYSYD